MLSAVSSLIVEDLDKSLLPVRGITESQDIKPFTLLTEKTPKRWIPFASKQYKVHNFLVSLYYIYLFNFTMPFENVVCIFKTESMMIFLIVLFTNFRFLFYRNNKLDSLRI